MILNLLRGSGSDGLGGMDPVRALTDRRQDDTCSTFALVGAATGHRSLLRDRGVDFRHDEMNEDETFARVRVRHRLLPLMESFNPRVIEALSRTAELLREDSRALESAAERFWSCLRTGQKVRPAD